MQAAMTLPLPTLEQIRRAVSPRYAPRPIGTRAILIHGFVIALWFGLLACAVGAHGLLAWSVGLAYVGYDTLLLGFVFVQTLKLLRTTPAPAALSLPLPRLAVIIAAHNEAAALPATLAALCAQDSPPDEVLLADDGSDDATALLMARAFGLPEPKVGETSPASPVCPALCWLRLPRGGKARALNAALARVHAEIVLTVDADTVVEPGAILAVRRAFAAEPGLVAASGVLFPVCARHRSGRLLQRFQHYEYIKNFLSRYAWSRQGALLLISGAFAAYRRVALLAVGGFETDCLVEDYELTHRLLDYSAAHALGWRTDVIGAACARTDAPGSLAAFLRQRRRWFGGFLQTHSWYRHMVGDPRYGRLGTRMLPIKACDTMEPLYGLAGILLLVVFAALGRFGTVVLVLAVIGAKMLLDLVFYAWSLALCRRWLGERARVEHGSPVLVALAEPFTFQVLRQAGAVLGWLTFLSGERDWARTARTAARAASPAEVITMQ